MKRILFVLLTLFCLIYLLTNSIVWLVALIIDTVFLILSGLNRIPRKISRFFDGLADSFIKSNGKKECLYKGGKWGEW
jgi:hypothetical protein